MEISISIKHGIEVVLCLCVLVEYLYRLKHVERQPTKFEYTVYLITALSLFFIGFQISK